MAMLKNAQQYDWSTWLLGIMRSLVTGASGAIAGGLGPMATDGHDFNVSTPVGLHHLLVSMGISATIAAVLHMAMFLQTHSAPDLVIVKETETTVTKLSANETKVSAVETTTTVPATDKGGS